MADDWRVTVTLPEHEHARGLLSSLRERDLSDELRDALKGRVAVSTDGPSVFLYADTRRAAEAGEQSLRDALAELGVQADPKLEHWHPVEERWEDPSVTLTPGQEHDRLEAEEVEESKDEGIAEWEVRVELASHQDAEQLAETLEGQGYGVTRRWSYLLVSANDKDDAEALAKQLQAEAPNGAKVHVEPGAGLAWELMPRNPYAFFLGGLGE